MNHIRQQIREQFATDLTGLTTTGSNVFQSRIYPLQVADLPGLTIYSDNTFDELNGIGANYIRTTLRNLLISIEAFAQHLTTVDDTLDTICKEVETAISNSSVLDNLCLDWFLESTDFDLIGDSLKPTGKVTLIYNVLVDTVENLLEEITVTTDTTITKDLFVGDIYETEENVTVTVSESITITIKETFL